MSLTEDEAISRRLFDTTQAGIGLLRNGKILKVNEALCQITGYPQQELVGQSARMLFPDDDVECGRIAEALNGQLQLDGCAIPEVPLRRKDGATTYVLLCLSPYDLQDLSNGVTLTALEVTARHEAEKELKRIKVAIDSTADAIGMATADGQHFYHNQAFNKMFGFTVEEVALRHPIAAYKDKEVGREVFDAIMAGRSWYGELDMIAKDGRCLPIFLRADAVKDANGKVISVIGVHTDMSERKKALEDLVRSEEKYRNIFQNAMEGIFQTSPDGRLISANPALARMAGYESPEQMRDELTNFDEQVYVHAEARRDVLETLARQGYVHGFEFEAYKRNKDIIWVAVNARQIGDDRGNVLRIEGMIYDVTDRKKAEAERVRLENMLLHMQKIESIGRLAGGIAHDFNNLLTAILGNTEIVMCDLDPQGELYQHLATAMKAAEGAAGLTKQLLAFSRKQIIEPRIVNSNDLIERLSRVLLTLVGENISLQIVRCDDLHPIRMDPGQFEQIILNLATNARDAMPNGGKLLVETANKCLDDDYCRTHAAVSPGDYVMVAVSDTGTGMTADVLDHLFEPFFTTKEKGKGTGLGLATVYGIVKQNGGIIEAYSELDHGTTFKIYFPRMLADTLPLRDPGTGNAPPTGSETILLIEDNAEVLELARSMLSNAGYRVMVATSGEAALAISAGYTDAIHLLMTDVILTGMNGRETAEAIADCRSGLKVLYCSGYTADAIDRHGILEQGLNFLPKPFTVRSLLEKVREVLDRDKAEPAGS